MQGKREVDLDLVLEMLLLRAEEVHLFGEAVDFAAELEGCHGGGGHGCERKDFSRFIR